MFTSTSLTGCKKSRDEDFQTLEIDVAIERIEKAAKSRENDESQRNRASLALSQLQNGLLDSRPILIGASLSVLEENEGPYLGIATFDEDRDLRGLRIREQHSGPDGVTTTLEEDYPIYAASLEGPILEVVIYPVDLRTRGQRKDEGAWRDYTLWALDEMIRRFVDKPPAEDTGTPGDDEPPMPMPTIYVSIPEPNELRVFATLYDRAGHESDTVEIRIPSWNLRWLTEAGGHPQQ